MSKPTASMVDPSRPMQFEKHRPTKGIPMLRVDNQALGVMGRRRGLGFGLGGPAWT